MGNRAGTLSKRATLAAPTTLTSVTTSVAQFNQNDWLTTQTNTTQTTGLADSTSQTTYGNGAETASQTGTATPLQNGWNFDGTLATTGTATAQTNFSYDASGNRLKVAKAGKEQRYLVDPSVEFAQVVQERDENNVLQARYLWEDGLAPLVQFRRTQAGDYAAFFSLCDGQDSVRQLTDAQGQVTDSYYYDAFGNALSGGTGTTPNPFRYTGQQDEGGGRYFLRARYYNSGTGRFLSHDPLVGNINDPVSLHRYVYANADAANYDDPSGLWADMGSLTVGSTISNNQNAQSNSANAAAYSRVSQALRPYSYTIKPPVNINPTPIFSPWELIPGSVGVGAFGVTSGIAVAIGAAFDNYHNEDVQQQVEDEDEHDEVLYHGTSSNRASHIVGSNPSGTHPGHDAEGFKGSYIYFAEDLPTARYFANESGVSYDRSNPRPDFPKSRSVITFYIPKKLADQLRISFPYRQIIGTARGLMTPDISGSSGYERVLSSRGNVEIFNQNLASGVIKFQRRKMR